MSRFCVCGCGNELKDKDGLTDYDRVFFNGSCRNRDKAQRMRDQRERMKKQHRCSKCGNLIKKKKSEEAHA